MEANREICRNCIYYVPGRTGGEDLSGAAMGECTNFESDYEHRTVDAAFSCEHYEPRRED